MRSRLPYLFVLAGTLIFFVYPRLMPASLPPVLRSDGIVGFAYGVAIGLELVGLMMLKNQRRCGPLSSS